MVRRSYGSTGGRGNSFPFSVVRCQFSEEEERDGNTEFAEIETQRAQR